MGSFFLRRVGICALLMATSCHATSQNSEETETCFSALTNAGGCAWSEQQGGYEGTGSFMYLEGIKQHPPLYFFAPNGAVPETGAFSSSVG